MRHLHVVRPNTQDEDYPQDEWVEPEEPEEPEAGIQVISNSCNSDVHASRNGRRKLRTKLRKNGGKIKMSGRMKLRNGKVVGQRMGVMTQIWPTITRTILRRQAGYVGHQCESKWSSCFRDLTLAVILS